MSNQSLFEFVCEQLEARTNFDRLEARGTVRLALKTAGLDVASVSRSQMQVVLERVLPEELTRRGIGDAEATCSALCGELPDDATAVGDSPEAVFARLGG